MVLGEGPANTQKRAYSFSLSVSILGGLQSVEGGT
jgi:hypothetical protein